MKRNSQRQSILNKYKGKPWHLISILQSIQEKEGYLSKESLEYVAQKMNLTNPQIYGVATFFKSLTLVPQGKHKVVLCLGTACHVRGVTTILNEVCDVLKVSPGQTTKDKIFTLEVVNCVGACAIGPVLVVDDIYYGHMTPLRAKNILNDYRKKYNEKTKKRTRAK